MAGRLVLCGVPREHCMGGYIQVGPWNRIAKAHGDRVSAFECRAHFLLKMGYERIDQRLFRPPDGGPILVVTRPSTYGMLLRPNKEGRWMPADDPPFRGGIIMM